MKIADEARRERKRALSRERKRRYRRRQREDVCCTLVELGRSSTEQLLIDLGLLPLDAADDEAVFRASMRAFVEWCVELGIETASRGTRPAAQRRDVA